MKVFLRILLWLNIILLFLVAYYRFWFLRQPERNVPNDEHIFVSPANGTVVSINPWNRESLTVTKEQFGAINVWTEDVDTAGTMVSIQLNVANVHYQRAPSSGKLLSEKYVTGSFNNAVSMSNEYGIRFENEHNELLFETMSGKRYKVIQIAGFLARRIEDYVTPQQLVRQGEVIGLIKLGSQVTLILPHNVKVAVKKGDTVVDGETALGLITDY
ncbi:MAG: phosphatidylserine decarboxylase [Bacteroidetes bacterium]|nr:phosphatidylserine decarboxylase [Bacteroidota bacterium]